MTGGARRGWRRARVAAAVAALALIGASAAGCGSSTSSSAAAQRERRTRLGAEHQPHRASTSHEALGYYRQDGINLQILPYGTTAPETLVASDKADFGISYEAGTIFARAAGEDDVSVFAILQHDALQIGVRANNTAIRTRQGSRRQDLCRLRHARRRSDAQVRHPEGGRHRQVHDRRPQHVGLRRGLERPGRLHAVVHDLGGHPGSTRRKAVQARVRADPARACPTTTRR